MTSPVATPVVPVALRDDHLPQALDLSRQLAWPYRLEDWAFAQRLGRGFAVELDGRLAGTALWWPYGDDYASTGMIIVSPDAQRRGIGAAMMDALLADAAGRAIILNATEEGRPLYERLGFVANGTVHQHQAVLATAPTLPNVNATIRELEPADLPAIRALDRLAAGMNRDTLLNALFAIGKVMVAERDGHLIGYACARVWGRGIVIGPVVGSDASVARALIARSAQDHPGAFVRIDVTGTSDLSPWLGTIGLPEVGQVVAMARGGRPAASDRAVLFALSNQSLG